MCVRYKEQQQLRGATPKSFSSQSGIGWTGILEGGKEKSVFFFFVSKWWARRWVCIRLLFEFLCACGCVAPLGLDGGVTNRLDMGNCNNSS